MKSIPSTSETISQFETVGVIPFYYVREWFSNYWASSYVRIITLRTVDENDINRLLAYALRTDPSNPARTPSDWLHNCEFTEIDSVRIKSQLNYCQNEIDESADRMASDEMIETKMPIEGISLDTISSAWEIKGLRNICNKHSFGPTSVIFWQRDLWFYYLELHQES